MIDNVIPENNYDFMIFLMSVVFFKICDLFFLAVVPDKEIFFREVHSGISLFIGQINLDEFEGDRNLVLQCGSFIFFLRWNQIWGWNEKKRKQE